MDSLVPRAATGSQLGVGALARSSFVGLLARFVPRACRLAVKVLAPDAFLRQCAALAVLIALRRVLWYSRQGIAAVTQRIMGSFFHEARMVNDLRRRRQQCKDYATFRKIGAQIDTALGLDRWKKDDNSHVVDAKKLKARTKVYKELMEQGDVQGCLFLLRQELLRKHFGICNPELFEVTNTGTKQCVEKYVNVVCEAMTWVAFEHRERELACNSDNASDTVPLADKLGFFTETKHSFGRSALLLSGGAQLGMYHFGVVKALHLNGLLPRILSGTSAGSIVCGMLCVRTDDELQELWAEDYDWATCHNLNFFGDFDFGRFVQRRGEALYSSDVLAKALQDNMGDMTFLEAFDRTGRVCNITVSGLPGSTQYPMLLNYLTSPHVLIWSAALASSSVPGIFEPRELLAKDRHGAIVPYYFGGLKWRDGSMQNDLPMTRLTELFNVNFFIVSQVNPHAILATGEGLGSVNSPMFKIAHFFRREIKQYLLSITELALGTAGRRVSPWLRPVGFSPVGLLVQEYTGDITIFNGRGIQEMPYLLTNGTTDMLRRYTEASERSTWLKLPLIENSCKIEFVMEEIIKELRREVVEGSTTTGPGGSLLAESPLIKRVMSQDFGIKRMPSFHQAFAGDLHKHSGPIRQGLLQCPKPGLHTAHKSSPLFASNQSLLTLLANPRGRAASVCSDG